MAVIGGGAAAVSAAANVAERWPDTRVDLYFPGDHPLAGHHRRAWEHLRRRLIRLGVGLHPGRRAEVPDGFGCDAITSGEVRWSTGQSPVRADAVGGRSAGCGPIPAGCRHHCSTNVASSRSPELRVPGHRGFSPSVTSPRPIRCGHRRATVPMRCWPTTSVPSGRAGPCAATPPGRRWGSVIGPQTDGLEVFTPTGGRSGCRDGRCGRC